MNLKLKQIKMTIGGLKELIITEVKFLIIGESDIETIKNLGIELEKAQDELTKLLRSGESLR